MLWHNLARLWRVLVTHLYKTGKVTDTPIATLAALLPVIYHTRSVYRRYRRTGSD